MNEDSTISKPKVLIKIILFFLLFIVAFFMTIVVLLYSNAKEESDLNVSEKSESAETGEIEEAEIKESVASNQSSEITEEEKIETVNVVVPDTLLSEGGNYLVSVPATQMSVRQAPGLGEDILAQISAGEILEWSGEEQKVEDKNFYKVKVVSSGVEGYVAAEYCSPYQFAYDINKLTIVDVSNELYSYDMMCQDLIELQNAYADRIGLEELGKSQDGRVVYGVTIGNKEASKHVMIQAGIHGREYISTQLIMKMIEYYATYYEEGTFSGKSYAELFGNIAFHIVPMSNPDGVTVSQYGVSALQSDSASSLIESCYEKDKESLIYEEDAKGYLNWADISKRDNFDRYEEGFDEIISFEEYTKIWKANIQGVDLNNNFDAGWHEIDLKESNSYSNYKGSMPESEAETAILVEYANRYDYDAYISYHSRGQLIYYDVFGNLPETSVKSENLARLLQTYNKYELVNTNKGYQVNMGGFSDWVQLTKNKPSCTVELGEMPCPVLIHEFNGMWNRNRETWALLAETLLVE